MTRRHSCATSWTVFSIRHHWCNREVMKGSPLMPSAQHNEDRPVINSVSAGKTAFVGATVIDGTGRAPVENGVVLTEGGRICAVGPAQETPVPADALIIDYRGKYLLPGLMDGNVHLVPWPSWTYIEFLARYEDRFQEVAVEAAQLALAKGFTTVFDSMGPLDALLAARDRIGSGAAEGARVFVAGGIVGFRAVFTTTASITSASQAFQNRINDRFEAGAGPELSWKTPKQIYEQMTRYAESGVDFIKYGATGDGVPLNSEIGQAAVLRFSPDQQRAIVEAAHDAGLAVQTHTTSAESLHIAVEVGNDAGQHASMTGPSRLYEHTIALMLDRGYVCGTQWGPLTEAQHCIVRHRNFHHSDEYNGAPGADFSLENAVRLIDAGVPQMLSTDAGTIDPDVAKDRHQWGGLGGAASLIGEAQFLNMQAMADRGMSPMQIVQAATINVATAYGVHDSLGTLKVGKVADLLALDRDPLQNVQNMRSVCAVVKDGRVVDLDKLPSARLLTAPAAQDPGLIRQS